MAGFDGSVVACPDCDLLQTIPPLPPGGTARCPRCGRTVALKKADSLDRVTALAFAALIAFAVGNAEPLMSLSASGLESTTTILGGVVEMWRQGEWITSVLIALFAVVAPALDIGFTLVVVLLARRPPAPTWVGTMLRWAEVSGRWSMVEVMLLGILVALVKIASVARVEPGIGVFATAALVVLMTAMVVSFDPADVWRRVRWANGEWPPGERESAGGTEGPP